MPVATPVPHGAAASSVNIRFPTSADRRNHELRKAILKDKSLQSTSRRGQSAPAVRRPNDIPTAKEIDEPAERSRSALQHQPRDKHVVSSLGEETELTMCVLEGSTNLAQSTAQNKSVTIPKSSPAVHTHSAEFNSIPRPVSAIRDSSKQSMVDVHDEISAKV